jgi:hypothetical protein
MPIRYHTELIELIQQFLNVEEVLHRWCCDIPADFFTRDKADAVARLLGKAKKSDVPGLSRVIQEWMKQCDEKPWSIFNPLAKVHAKQGLHGDWFPEPSLKVMTRIKAIVESDTSRDTLPTPS